MVRRSRHIPRGYSQVETTISREVEVRGESVVDVEELSEWFPEVEALIETTETTEVEYEIEGLYEPGEPAYTGRDENRWSPGSDPAVTIESVKVDGREIPESEWPDEDDRLEAAKEAAWEARYERSQGC